MNSKSAILLARVTEAQVRAMAQMVRGVNPGEGEHYAERISEEATLIDHLVKNFEADTTTTGENDE